LARRWRFVAWRARARRALPYLVGGVMFAVAVWVLRGTLARYDLADLRAELAGLSLRQVGLAVLFTGLSFAALVGYEFSALRMIGKRVPLGQMALASFATQSIAHSTGFAFIVGATLRYNFYAGRGLGLGDVAKIQVIFTATFTLGVATLAGAVVAVEPWRLAHATGLPAWLWRAAAGAGLALVVAYVVWGAFFHRPFRWRGREFALPGAGATLTQIFFGVADLMAVAAALHVLLPAELGLGYPEVLAIFMASIVVGLMSHVPGSLGVFESAVILLVQPSGPQTLPLLGALLAFRGAYYLLPLACGVAVLAATELRRWRGVARRLGDLARLDLGPGTPRAAAALTFVAGLALLLPALARQPAGTGPSAPALASGGAAELGRVLPVAGGVALLLLAPGVARRLAVAWRWALAILLVAALAGPVAGAPLPLPLFLAAVALLLFACRGACGGPAAARADVWHSPAWVMLVALTVASGFWLVGHG
jgi:uncharacterized membrane protein YbhN (UPF0104 family)